MEIFGTMILHIAHLDAFSGTERDFSHRAPCHLNRILPSGLFPYGEFIL
jgi:hypothetical protein